MDIDLYNTIYTKTPDRWGSDGRDEFLCERVKQPTSVLDIGCGTGHTLGYLDKKWPGTILYGVDISDVAIEIAKERVLRGLFLCGTVDDVLVPVDLVTLLGVAEHFEDLSELGRVKRVLKADGLVYLEIPNCLSYDFGTEGFRRCGLQAEWHLLRATWERIINEQGFEIVESIVGKKNTWEFVWILKEKKQ